MKRDASRSRHFGINTISSKWHVESPFRPRYRSARHLISHLFQQPSKHLYSLSPIMNNPAITNLVVSLGAMQGVYAITCLTISR